GKGQEGEKVGVAIRVLRAEEMWHLVDEVAERFPRLKIVMDHLALPSGKTDEEAFRDIGKLIALATRPNIAVKASTMPLYTTDKYPFRHIHPYIKQVFEAFGPRRTFWGSDLSRLHCPYRECVTMFTEEMPWLKGDDLEWVMGRGLSEWIGWP